MTNITNLAETLFHAHNIQKPLSKEDISKDISIVDAYEVQHQLTEMKTLRNQDKLAGYKISLTSEETQRLFDSTTPLYGALTQSSVSNGTIKLDDMLSPLIEVELMFIANEELSTADSHESILQKMSVAPGLEIPDSRFTDWFPKTSMGQVIADSAVAGKITVGESVNGLTYEQLGSINAKLTLNGEPLAEGPATEVLGNPVHAVAWLVKELAKSGRTIEKGMIISAGTFILPKKLEKGTYRVKFDKVGEVSLNVF
ncbi:2-keto-4-pentenoate hydratase [Virgibacillus siamensis]|uniref:2-keto-4-pentenoate hydratase n=2 Tax=Virgibacillus siamensis TaxID=480071 RepID=A0ABP3QKI0_9BACI